MFTRIPKPEKSLTLSRWAVNKGILSFEVSWHEIFGFAYYNKKLRRPIVPIPDTSDSGVTIGFGFDCGHSTAAQIRATWGSILPMGMVDALVKCAGKKKRTAVAMLPSVAFVDVPPEAAAQVFYNTTIYRYAKMAWKIYPELHELHPVEVAVIVGLVYNRGDELGIRSSRKEMRDLIKAINDDDDKTMADLIRAMCRLWPNIAGLKRRRNVEADLIAMPDDPIPKEDELVLVFA